MQISQLCNKFPTKYCTAKRVTDEFAVQMIGI